jgi:hypothetical protein
MYNRIRHMRVLTEQLIWQQIDIANNQHEYVTASGWCELAMHGAFDKTAELNIAKFQR